MVWLVAWRSAFATVPVWCATDDLHAEVEMAGNGQTVEIMDSATCDLGSTTLLIDESTSIIAAPGEAPTITGTANPLIAIDHGDVGAAVSVESVALVTSDGQTAIAIDEDDVSLVDLDISSGPGSDATAVTVAATNTGILVDGVMISGFDVTGAAAGLSIGTAATVEVTNSWFDTLQGGAGAAIDALDATLTVRKSAFCHVQSTGRGPGVHVGGGMATLQNNLFFDNSGGPGGTVSVQGTTVLELRNNHFVDNPAGGTHVDGPVAPTIDSNLFLENGNVAVDLQTGSTSGVDFNLYWANTTRFAGGISTPGSGGITRFDPDLVDWPTAITDCSQLDLRPMAASPLIDAGTFDTNYDDDAAFSGDRNDIGAYGGPERDPTWDDIDQDGDGYLTDCDDLDPAFSQFEPDVCDALDLDQDCSGVGDDDPSEHVELHADDDGDGFGTTRPSRTFIGCPEDAEPGTTWLEDATDCNDFEPLAFPGAYEACDDLDNDCNGAIDDSPEARSWGPDADGDGFGDPNGPLIVSCAWPPGHAPIDQPDCNDANPLVRPFLPEYCDGLDSNCDGYVLEDKSDAFAWYLDDDEDGYGVEGQDPDFMQCAPPGPGYSPTADDCGDTQPTVHPFAPELCDGLDNDCNLATDDEPAFVVWYFDNDLDGFGDAFWMGLRVCDPPGTQWADNALDCNDEDPADFGLRTFWPDLDMDGYGDDREPGLDTCVAPDGWVDNNEDCADWLSGVNPDGTEIVGDEIDNDCDGEIDETGGTTGPYGDDDDDDMEPVESEPKGEDGCQGCGTAGTDGSWLLLVALTALRRGRSGSAGD